MPSFRKKSDLYVRQGQGETQDEFVQIFGETEYNFYSVANSRDQLVVLDASDNEFMSVFIRLDAETEKYERRVYSFSDLLAQVGGLYSSIFFIGIILVGIFSERLFVSSILRKIYQIDEIRETHIKQKHEEMKQNKGSAVTEQNIDNDDNENN